MYRLNKYAYFFKYNKDVLCLNLINKRIIIIEESKYDLIIRCSDNLEVLNKENANLWSLLYKLGFIVEQFYDEYFEIKTNYNVSVFNDSSFRLTVIPTLNCNYNCWYCYEDHVKEVMSKSVQESVIKLVENKIYNQKIKQINLDWFGGEPLICFNDILYPLSKKIKQLAMDNNVFFSNQITTNGYLFNLDNIQLLSEISLKNFQITLDGNECFHNKVKKNKLGDSYRTVVRNINSICKNIDDLNFTLRINWTDKNIIDCTDIIKDIEKINRHKIKVSFQRVWQLKDLNNTYSQVLDKSKEEFRNNGFQVDDFSIPFVQACYADKYEQAVINYDGLVFKCTARDFNSVNADGVLNSKGEINWDRNKFYKRMGRAKFSHKKCKECDLLPACYGPCSQKVLEISDDNFDKICNYHGVKATIDEILKRKYHEIIGQ